MELEEIEGIGKATAKRLREAGYTSVEALAVTPARELMPEGRLQGSSLSRKNS